MRKESNPFLVLTDELTLSQIASLADHTFLKRSECFPIHAHLGRVRARKEAFFSFLEETLRLPTLPFGLCVRPEDVRYAASFFKDKPIRITSVVGFPDGASYSTKLKLAETEVALQEGAHEIDMVLNYEAFKHGEIGMVRKETEAITQLVHEANALLKLIIEISELDNEEIPLACQLANDTGCDFVKTSTGFGQFGAKVEQVRLIRSSFQRGVKISGGVTQANVKELLKATSMREDGRIELNPFTVRIGESSLFSV